MFVTPAFAHAAGGAGAGSAVASFLPLVLIFAIMYFLLIRPQQKRAKDLRAMVDALRRGDQVLTQGGIIGKVTKVNDDATPVIPSAATTNAIWIVDALLHTK